MTDNLIEVPALLEIARRAIEAEKAATQRKAQIAILKSAYLFYKRSNRLERVERDTPEWEAMMSATSGEYDDAEKGKSAEKNARRRMQTAINAYQRKVSA